jgi:hypothetical protein
MELSMVDLAQIDPIRGRTIRLTWTEGPTKGKTHEHVFHQDGTVEWGKERVPYRAMRAGEEVWVMSYLSLSGYTLTVALNFRDRTMVGFASSDKDWHPLRGTFEMDG